MGTGTVTIDKWGNVGEIVTALFQAVCITSKRYLTTPNNRTAALNAEFSFFRTEQAFVKA